MDVRRSRSEAPPRSRRERGFAIVLSTMLVLPLFVAVGLGVDVGSWYLRATRIQHAADAAALAGVVYQPDFVEARRVALAEAAANGFDATDPDIEVIVTDVGNERLAVTIRDTDVDLFFTSAVMDGLTIQRSSMAEYLKPIPLGSPSNVFGNRDVDPGTTDPEFWAAVNGPASPYGQGDPYITRCFDAATPFDGTTCASSNPEYRPGGYWFAVDVDAAQVGRSIAVWLFDPGLAPRSGLAVETGDYSFITGAGTPYPTTVVSAHDQDGSPLDYTDNPVIPWCVLSVPGSPTATYRNQWVKLCDFTPTFEGIYPVQVQSTGAGNAMNGYSVAATLTGCGPAQPLCDDPPRVYALGDMSLYINALGGTSEFFLGEIGEQRAGDSFVVRAFDPGDGSDPGTYTLTLVPPPSLTLASCRYRGVDHLGTVVVPETTAANCAIVTRAAGTSIFNGLWLEIEVNIPPSFACDPGAGDDCWWTMRYDVPGRPQDRVTFQVFSASDPVHLVAPSED